MTTRLAIAIGLLASVDVYGAVTFEKDVKPIFREHCAGCHNQDDAASDFAADGFDAILAGGAGGEVVAPGDLDGSRLWRLITHAEQPAMPPGGDKLPDDQLAIIRAWIEGGLLKDDKSKPIASKKAAIAVVDIGDLGKPVGEPAMPKEWYREPVITSDAVGPVESLAASSWAPAAAVPWQRQVALYHTETNDLLGVTPYLEGAPHVVRFSRDGSLLLVAGGREGALGTAAVIDVVSGARLATVGDELDTVLAADISPDNQLVAIGGPKKKVRVYRVADGSLAYTCEKHTDWVTAISFSPDNKLLATGDRSAGLRLWQAEAGHERGDLRGHTLAITSLAWRPGVLASASEDGSVRWWNSEGGQVKSFPAHGGGALSVAFASDGRLVTAGRDRLVKLWNADAGHVADLTQTDDVALAAVFVQGDKRVVISDWSGKVRVLDIESKQPVAMLTPNPPTLAQRVEEAEKSLADLQAKQTEATTLSTEKGKALQLAQQAHDAFNKRIADAEQSLAAALRALDEAQAVMKGRTGAETRASEAKTAADTVLAEATKKLDEARKANAPNVAELVSAVADADSAVHAATAALGETQTLRVEAEGLAGQTAQRKTAADQLLAEANSQRAGLPDLAPLQTEADAATQALNALTQQVAQATTARDAAVAERERYAAAADELAKRAEQTLAEVTALETIANEAASREAEAAKAAETAAEATKALQTQLEAIKQQIRDSRAKQAESKKSLAALEAEAATQQTKLSEAQRRAQVAEAKLNDLKATNEWRAEQVAKE